MPSLTRLLALVVAVVCLAACAGGISQKTADELRNLKSLRDEGVLTEREYKTAKDALLKKYIGSHEGKSAGGLPLSFGRQENSPEDRCSLSPSSCGLTT